MCRSQHFGKELLTPNLHLLLCQLHRQCQHFGDTAAHSELWMEREIQHVKHYSRNKATHEPEKLVTILMALTHATRTASHDVAALDLAAASEAGSDSSEQSEGEAGGGLQEAGARDQRGRRGGRQPLDDGRGNDGCCMIGKGRYCQQRVCSMDMPQFMNSVRALLQDQALAGHDHVAGWTADMFAGEDARARVCVYTHASAQQGDTVYRSAQHKRARKRDDTHMAFLGENPCSMQVQAFVRIELIADEGEAEAHNNKC